MGRYNKPRPNTSKRINSKPKNETEATLDALKNLMQSRKESERYFAKLKLKAYENAEVLKSGVRVKRKGESKASFPNAGDTLTVRYVGSRPDGKFFDSGNFTFILGKGDVISGWDQAFKVIREGQDATIFCPSPTAYGKAGAGKLIPPRTTLIFDVTLLKVVKSRAGNAD